MQRTTIQKEKRAVFDSLLTDEELLIFKFCDQILISGFEFQPGSNLGRSRAGRMVESPMGNWRISPEFAGTKSDNFITRAFDRNIQDKIVNAVKKTINKRL